MNLSTDYLRFPLKNPIVAAASPLSRTVDGVRRLEDAGAAAVVLYSLFAEQITMADHPLGVGPDGFVGTWNDFPSWTHDPVGPEEYLEHIRLVKQAVQIPIIASLNGAAPGDWIRYARLMEDAGADALELNLYSLPTSPHASGESVEQTYIDVVRAVTRSLAIPVAVKLSPFFSSLPYTARRLAEAGADALVLFNRFYQPDIDLETHRTQTRVEYSTSADLRLPLRWVALLYKDVPCDLALTGGVHTHEDVLKAVYAGANVTMMASELLQNGVGRIGTILAEMTRWMEANGRDSILRLRGRASEFSAWNPATAERGSYIAAIGAGPPAKPESRAPAQ